MDESLRKTMDKAIKKEKNRERIETRIAYTTSDIDWLFGKEKWEGLACIGAINTKFETENAKSNEWHYYADRAISEKKADNRPQFIQMIADSKQAQFDAIIVWKIDRFSRDKYDSVYYKNVLKKNSVSVISATEPIDDSPEGQLMESIFEGFSAYYIKDLAMKVSRGMTENALKCKFNGGAITYGYFIDEDKHFQPDPVK